MAAEGVQEKARQRPGEQVQEGEEAEGVPAPSPARRGPAGAAGRAPRDLKGGHQEPGCAGSLGVSGAQNLPWEQTESPGEDRKSPTLHPGLRGDFLGENPSLTPTFPMDLSMAPPAGRGGGAG